MCIETAELLKMKLVFLFPLRTSVISANGHIASTKPSILEISDYKREHRAESINMNKQE